MMITITYSMASLRLARQNALIQQVNAVESLSHVNICCMDKTGTLTANILEFHKVRPIRGSAQDAEAALGAFAHSVTPTNKTSDALAAMFGGKRIEAVDEVPYSSARNWSAISLDGDVRGTFALGAPEMLGSHLATNRGDPPAEWLEVGLRALLWPPDPRPPGVIPALENWHWASLS